jgi:hypothetical protein
MNELIPIIFGVLSGGCVAWLRRRPRARLASSAHGLPALALLAGVLGPVATIITGEYRESALFFLFDFGIVLAAGWAVARVASLAWGRRRQPADVDWT